MKSPSHARWLSAAGIPWIMLLCSCDSVKPLETTSSHNRWPFTSFAEVRAYVFANDAPKSQSTHNYSFNKGSYDTAATPNHWDPASYHLPKGLINPEGTPLNPAQVERLLKAANSHRTPRPPADCYDPHHLFVFFDSSHHPVAYLELCFHCNNSKEQPPLAFTLDWSELRKLTLDLGLPILKEGQDYWKLRNHPLTHKASNPA
jgi:hypothetical protein